MLKSSSSSFASSSLGVTSGLAKEFPSHVIESLRLKAQLLAAYNFSSSEKIDRLEDDRFGLDAERRLGINSSLLDVRFGEKQKRGTW